MRARFSRLLVASLIIGAGAAHAQVPVAPDHSITRLEITPFVGYRWGGDVDGWDLSFGSNRLDGQLDSGTGFGLALDIPLGADSQIQLLYDTQSSEITTGRDLFDGSATASGADISYAHVGLVRNWFRPSDLAFFLSFSGGVTRVELDAPGLGEQTQPSVGIGAGLKYFPARHWAVRLEARQYWTRMDDEEEYHTGDYTFFFPSDFLQTTVNLGVSYVW